MLLFLRFSRIPLGPALALFARRSSVLCRAYSYTIAHHGGEFRAENAFGWHTAELPLARDSKLSGLVLQVETVKIDFGIQLAVQNAALILVRRDMRERTLRKLIAAV